MEKKLYSKNVRILMEDLAEDAKIRGFINEGNCGPKGLDLTKPQNRPGYVILNLPADVRETLSHLKSDDIKNHDPYRFFRK